MKNHLLSATQIAALRKRFERCKTQILALDWVTQGSLEPKPTGQLALDPKSQSQDRRPSPFPTNRPNFFVEPSTTIESLKNSSTRCELLASRCSSTPSKDPHVEKEEYHPKCALTSRHSGQPLTYDLGWLRRRVSRPPRI